MNRYRSHFLITLFTLLVLNGCYKPATKAPHLCPASPVHASGAINNLPLGCFDYYLFAQSWSPEFCIDTIQEGTNQINVSGCKQLSKNFTDFLKPHGLWQNLHSTLPNKSAYPAFCTDEPFDLYALDKKVGDKIIELYPLGIFGLPLHEWEKHGTCDGSTQNEYFEKIIFYQNKFAKKREFLNDWIGKPIDYTQLVDALGGEGYINIDCQIIGNTQYLKQIFSYHDKNTNPIKIDLKGNCDQDKSVRIRGLGAFLSISEWEDRLNKNHRQPINVGFDIDDTVLFSSPLFHYLNTYTNLDSSKQEFWSQANNGLDKFSLPKQSAKKLLEVHTKRGDNIIFITKRGKSDSELVTKIVSEAFKLSLKQPVIFTDNKDKTPFIKENSIKVYYGDSNGDIVSARKAGAEGIRILRPKNSDNTQTVYPGSFNEIVIDNSEY